MALSAEEYKKKIASIEALLPEKKKKLGQAKEKLESAREALSKKETDKHSFEYALHGVKIGKIWMIFAILAGLMVLAAVILPVFQMRQIDVETFWQGYTYNGVPTIATILAVVFAALAVVFLAMKKKKIAQISKDLQAASDEYDREKEVFDGVEAAYNGTLLDKENDENEIRRLREQMYADHPEEYEKAKAEKEAEKQRALDELRKEEEINLRAATEAQKKREDMALGQKMFDHPQAYILDGQFENEYAVFEAAAELGCEDAQIRVCEIQLGISYKSGVKPDPQKGEERALRYAAGGNSALYEVLGKAFLYGEGDIKKDEQKGLRYLEKAASRGRQRAMIMAAVCHYNGVGTDKDEARARAFFEKAAKQGNAQAIRVIAAMDNGEKLKF